VTLKSRTNSYHWIIELVFTFLSVTSVVANDGVFAGSSGVLHPLKPTRIRIHHEWLSIRFHELYADVNVRFHFYNPDDSDVVLPVGFVVPRCDGGDVTAQEYNSPGVGRFHTQLNGQLQSYKLFEWPCDTCALQPPTRIGKDIHAEDTEFGYDFVFLSSLRFKPGLNIVTHAYRQETGMSYNTTSEFDYVLTTAQHWQGQVIDTFECDITPLPNVVIYVSGFDSITCNGIIGIGGRLPSNGLEDDPYSYAGNQSFRLLEGSLHFSSLAFHPHGDLSITLLDYREFSGLEAEQYESDDSDESKRYGHEINVLYASHGLIFADTTVQREFEKTSWYIPDPNCTVRNMHFSKREQERLTWLNKQIKQFKKSTQRSPSKHP